MWLITKAWRYLRHGVSGAGTSGQAQEDMTKGLVCAFCGQFGFETQEELEEHIEQHPNVRRK